MEAGLADHIMDHPRTAKHLVHSYVTPRLALAILLVFPSIRSHATAANVIVEDSGIVIAIDSQRNVSRSGDRIGKIQGTKMFLIQNRLAIACLGYCTYRFGPMRSGDKILILDYDFAAWVLNIKPGLPVKRRFDDFDPIIKSEVIKMIPEQ